MTSLFYASRFWIHSDFNNLSDFRFLILHKKPPGTEMSIKFIQVPYSIPISCSNGRLSFWNLDLSLGHENLSKSKFTSRFCFLARIVKSYKISEYVAFGNLFLMWESREIWPLVSSWNKRRGSLKCTSVSTGHRLEKNSDLDRPQSSGTNSLIFIRFFNLPGEHVWS